MPEEHMKSQKKGSVLKHPTPSKYLEKIGDITDSFALLEIQIQYFMWSLLGLTPRMQHIGQIITSELSFKQLRIVLISLYKEKYGENNNYKKMRDLMDRAGKTEEKRKQITHSFWGTGKDIDSVACNRTTAKEKCGLRSKFEYVTLYDLAKMADDIKKLAAEIQDFNLTLLYNMSQEGINKAKN